MADDFENDFSDESDALAQALRARCPRSSLNAALPWDTLTEPEREAWRTLGDAALELCGPAESRTAYLIALRREMTRQTTDALRPYVRHLEGCVETPCRCGLIGLLP